MDQVITATLPYKQIRMPKNYMAVKVSVQGGKGGDTPTFIGQNHANAVKILANILQVSIKIKNIELYLFSFHGGDSAHTIPGQAEAVVVFDKEKWSDFNDLMIQGSMAVEQQFGASDAAVEVIWTPSIVTGNIFNEESSRTLLAVINGMPTGVLEHQEAAPQVVTCNNIGYVKQNKTSFELGIECHSQKDADCQLLVQKLSEILEVAGAEIQVQ